MKIDLFYAYFPSGKSIILNMMRLAFLLFFTVSFGFTPFNGLSQDIKVNLNTNKTLMIDEVFDLIEEQTPYRFVYPSSLIRNLPKVNVKKGTITVKDLLESSFLNVPVEYEFRNKKNIVLSKVCEDTAVNTDEEQQQTITGTVTDEDRVPLPGVNITVKGTTKGTSTDFDGNYTIQAEQGQTLIFSFVGFEEQTLTIENNVEIDVVLKSGNSLDEVVVTSLGITKERRALSYAVSEIETGEMTKARELNVGNALSGRVAGVTASSTSGGPGASSRVVIRGNGTLSGNNQPLYVVNGMPITNENTSSPGTYGGIDRGDGLSSINADDIESISVLKGGTAAALYGARAANGVVLITTKSGESQGRLGVEYNTNFTFDQPIDLLDWQYEYGAGSGGKAPTSQSEAIAFGRTSWGAKLDGSMVVQPDGEERPYLPVKDNIRNFYQTGSTFTNTLALSGGNDVTNFRFSVSNVDNEGIVPNNTLTRKTFNLGVGATLAEKIKFEGNAMYTIEKNKNRTRPGDFDRNPNAGAQLIANNVDVRTLSPGYLDDGSEFTWSDYIYVTNPYFVINKVRNGDTQKRFIGSFGITYSLTDFLYARVRLGIDQLNLDGFFINPTGLAPQPPGNMTTDRGIQTETNIEATVGFNKEFGDFSLDALIGGNQMRNVFDGVDFSSGDFNIPNEYFIENGSSQQFSNNYAKSGINSVFGSIDLGYNDYLYLNLTGRNDWFSTLSKSDNNLFYPSIGLSFLASQAMNTRPKWMDYFKVRASWAQVGGGAPSPYAIQKTYSAESVQYFGQTLTNVSSSTISADLTPYTSTTVEAGFELNMLDNRIGIDFTVYDRTTTDDIVNASIPPSSGYNDVALNVGEMRNRGIELGLAFTPFGRSEDGLNWDSNVNTAYNDNKVIKISDDLDRIMLPGAETRTLNGAIYHFEGEPFGMIAGNRRLQNEHGEIVYNDKSKSPEAGPTVPLGKGVPPLSIGFSNNFSYKNFSLNFLLDSRWGGSIYSATNAYGTDYGLHKMTVKDNVRETGVELSGVDQDGNDFSATTSAENYYRSIAYRITEDFVQKSNFIKLRSLSLGYNFPESLLEKTPISRANISIVGRNLLILYKSADNIDPESNYSNGNAQGLENFGLPSTRSFGIDLNVSF